MHEYAKKNAKRLRDSLAILSDSALAFGMNHEGGLLWGLFLHFGLSASSFMGCLGCLHDFAACNATSLLVATGKFFLGRPALAHASSKARAAA